MLRRLIHLARPHARSYVAGFFLLIATNALGLSIPWFLRTAVDAMEQGEPVRRVATLAGAMALLALAQALVRTASRLAILGASRRVAADIRASYLRQLQALGATFHDGHRTGDLMSRGVNDVQVLQSLFGPGALNLFNTTIMYVGSLGLLFHLDATLTVVALSIFPALFLVVNRLSRRVHAASVAAQEQLAEVANRAQESFSGHQQVKVFAQEEREVSGFQRESLEYARRSLRLTRLRATLLSVIGFAAGCGTLLVLLVGGRHVIDGRLTLGAFVAFNTYLGLLAYPTIALGWIVNLFQRGRSAMLRIDEILTAVPDLRTSVPTAADRHDLPPRFDISIRGLAFRHAGAAGAGALRRIDLELPEGARVAIVGPVGSGKSTLIHLLARTWPIARGTVLVGGADLDDIPVSAWRSAVGLVPQEPFLFSRSLRQNLVLGRPGATDAEVEDALEAARLTEDVHRMPQGLATLIGERGVTLSGGQRQRATLARALLVHPRLLLLDDSLSSVDADTEQAILAGLSSRLSGTTLVFVTHRLAGLHAFDLIVVLEEGRVAEQGTHAQLVARGGAYARLLGRQALENRLESA